MGSNTGGNNNRWTRCTTEIDTGSNTGGNNSTWKIGHDGPWK